MLDDEPELKILGCNYNGEISWIFMGRQPKRLHNTILFSADKYLNKIAFLYIECLINSLAQIVKEGYQTHAKEHAIIRRNHIQPQLCS